MWGWGGCGDAGKWVTCGTGRGMRGHGCSGAETEVVCVYPVVGPSWAGALRWAQRSIG